MSDEALIEELARVIGKQIEGPAEDMDGPWYGKPLWASYTNEARAILPIIRRREIEAGEKVNTLWLFGKQLRDLAMQHYRDWDGEPEDVAELRTAIAAWDSALDVAAIIGGEHD